MPKFLKNLIVALLLLTSPFIADLLYARQGWAVEWFKSYFILSSAIFVSARIVKFLIIFKCIRKALLFEFGFIFATVAAVCCNLITPPSFGVYIICFQLLLALFLSALMIALQSSPAESFNCFEAQNKASTISSWLMPFSLLEDFVSDGNNNKSTFWKIMLFNGLFFVGSLAMTWSTNSSWFLYGCLISVFILFLQLLMNTNQSIVIKIVVSAVFLLLGIFEFTFNTRTSFLFVMSIALAYMLETVIKEKKYVAHVWIYSALLINVVYPPSLGGEGFQLLFITISWFFTINRYKSYFLS